MKSAISLAVFSIILLTGCGGGGGSDSSSGNTGETSTPTTPTPPTPPPPVTGTPDFGQSLDILVIGSSRSINSSAKTFRPSEIATELEAIFNGDSDVTAIANVVSQDVYTSKNVSYGLGSTFHYRHSLLQYYYWPEGKAQRLNNLKGQDGTDWDFVVMLGDPYLISTLPGFYALGVNKIASKVAEGGAQPLLLMQWPETGSSGASLAHFSEYTYRTGFGSKTSLPVIPAGLAWGALPSNKKVSAAQHPSENGAYLAASSIYSQLMSRSSTASNYVHDAVIANQAWTTSQQNFAMPSGQRSFVSPFKAAEISDRVINYNQTGTSTEAGIRGGLNWVFGKAKTSLTTGGASQKSFNYGRANTNYEPQKRYKIEPLNFKTSFGFPMQDKRPDGLTSQLYGLDKRSSSSNNGTDAGVALLMVRESEIPYGKAIPVRSLLAQMQEINPAESGWRDGIHISRELDKAIGAYMFTMLTGHCALDAEPADKNSSAWRDWVGHKVGYETAWTLMHMRGQAPCLKVLPSSSSSTTVTFGADTKITVQFVNPPTSNVTISLTTDKDSDVNYSPKTLTFTPQNYANPQTVNMQRKAGSVTDETFTITSSTSSQDKVFDQVEDKWTYTFK